MYVRYRYRADVGGSTHDVVPSEQLKGLILHRKKKLYVHNK